MIWGVRQHQTLGKFHDLCDPCLVICAKNAAAISDNELLPNYSGRNFFFLNPDSIIQTDGASGILFENLRVGRTGNSVACIHVSNKPDGFLSIATFGRYDCIDNSG